VGLTPEFLPMIVTITLAQGASRMAKEKVIVKHLESMQNFGSIDVLCSDKTGTFIVEQNGEPLLISKGAPESVLCVCSTYEADGQSRDKSGYLPPRQIVPDLSWDSLRSAF
jgi:magnesium-transporting ATPase (P-type)